MPCRGPWAADARWCPCWPACLWAPKLVASLVLRTRQWLSGCTLRKEPLVPQLFSSGRHRPQALGVWPAFQSPPEWSLRSTESASPECSAKAHHTTEPRLCMRGVEPEPSAGPEGHHRDSSLTASLLSTTPPACSSLASKATGSRPQSTLDSPARFQNIMVLSPSFCFSLKHKCLLLFRKM